MAQDGSSAKPRSARQPSAGLPASKAFAFDEFQSEQRHRAEVNRKWLLSVFTDAEFKQISNILGLSPHDESARLTISTGVIASLNSMRRLVPSKKKQRQQLERIRSAASRLHDALVELLASDGRATALLGLAIAPASTWYENDLEEEETLGLGFLEVGSDVMHYAPGDLNEKLDAADRVCLSFHHSLTSCEKLRDAAADTLAEHFNDPREMRGRPPDFERDEVVKWAASLYRRHRNHRPTLTTHPPLDNHTTYAGEFYQLANIMDRAYLRAAGRDPDAEARIGSVVKRLTTKWSRQGKEILSNQG
jgi:hypothetical protein